MEGVELTTNLKRVLELPPATFVRTVSKAPKVREIDSAQMITDTLNLIAYIGLADKIKEPATDYDKREIRDLLRLKYPGLTFPEMYYAFKLNRFNELEEFVNHYQSLDAKYVSRVLDQYVEYKREIKRKHNIVESLPEMTLSRAEQNEILMKGLDEAYDHWKETRQILPGKLYIYDLIAESGLFPISKQDKWDYYKRAKDDLIVETQLLQSHDLKTARSIKEVMKDIQQEKSDRVAMRAKQNVIADFFKHISREQLYDIIPNIE